jgi:hypothetical protein
VNGNERQRVCEAGVVVHTCFGRARPPSWTGREQDVVETNSRPTILNVPNPAPTNCLPEDQRQHSFSADVEFASSGRGERELSVVRGELRLSVCLLRDGGGEVASTTIQRVTQ